MGEVAHVLDRAADVPVGHLVGAADERGQDGFVAEIIDDAGNALAAAVDGAERPFREVRTALAAGEREPVLDVVLDVGERERVQLVVDEDALAQLADRTTPR